MTYELREAYPEMSKGMVFLWNCSTNILLNHYLTYQKPNILGNKKLNQCLDQIISGYNVLKQ